MLRRRSFLPDSEQRSQDKCHLAGKVKPGAGTFCDIFLDAGEPNLVQKGLLDSDYRHGFLAFRRASVSMFPGQAPDRVG
jgi:hypothetical protein